MAIIQSMLLKARPIGSDDFQDSIGERCPQGGEPWVIAMEDGKYPFSGNNILNAMRSHPVVSFPNDNKREVTKQT
ncbi:hypothetical protein [Azospirillum sp.]|uniref:hypothetical protein n=1 Tax=Azospirillum sp. TaxID=34012 RepID=UPI003D75B813